MEEEEFKTKYVNLRILKSIQDYLNSESNTTTAVYPIKVPDELLYQVVKIQGPESADELIHQIFKMGLRLWNEKLYNEVFGSEENLQAFIELVRRRNKE